jgi:ribosomal protein L21E
MSAQTKAELLEGLGARTTKAELVQLLGSKLKKDELTTLLEDESDATKEELVRKLNSRTKDELVEAVGAHLTKDELQRAVDAHSKDDDDNDDDRGNRSDQKPQRATRERDSDGASGDAGETSADTGTDLDWSAELDWSPPPRPTPAPVQFVGAAPYMPGQRVRVDLAGLPTMGVFAGKGASAAGTIVGVDARAREVRVYLDAVFDGEKEIILPPERVAPDG